jgi:hypothetical protein
VKSTRVNIRLVLITAIAFLSRSALKESNGGIVDVDGCGGGGVEEESGDMRWERAFHTAPATDEICLSGRIGIGMNFAKHERK